MDTLSKVAAIIFALFILFMLVRYIMANPQSLSLSNLNKSLFTMGILGIGLIIFVGFIVMLLRRS